MWKSVENTVEHGDNIVETQKFSTFTCGKGCGIADECLHAISTPGT